MSGPAKVDVLAVMLQAEVRCGPGLSDAVLEARDAVAELVEADREMDAANDAYHTAPTGYQRNAAWERFVAARTRRADALARIGGAA